MGWEDPLKEDIATHSSILAWRIPMDRGADGLQSMGSQRVRHDQATKHSTYLKLTPWAKDYQPIKKDTFAYAVF